MNTDKKRRLAKFKRKRKDLRMTNFTQHWLNALTAYYQTSETAIIEAAVLALGDRHLTDALAEKFHKQEGQTRQYVEKAQNYGKIGENIEIGEFCTAK